MIDANILFAALIKEGKTSELICNEKLILFAPKFILEEYTEKKEEILRKTHRSQDDFYKSFSYFCGAILSIDVDSRNYETISPDPDDSIYFALALKLNCPIWSNDKRLKEQNQVRIISTEELINILNKL